MRILLVEDDFNLGTSLKSSLTAASYSVDWVQTCLAAETVIAAVDFDLVILDIGLPDASGLTLLATLRNHAVSETLVPVLIVTAFDSLRDRVAGLDAGADDYLVKPFMLDELLARVRALVRRKSGAPSSVVQHGRLRLVGAEGEVETICGGLRVVFIQNQTPLVAGHTQARGGAILDFTG